MHKPGQKAGFGHFDSKKTITVADGFLLPILGVIMNIPVKFGQLKAKIEILVVDGLPIVMLQRKLKSGEAKRLHHLG